MTEESRFFGAAFTSSYAITEYLRDKRDAQGCKETLRKAKQRFDGRMYRCAKKFGFTSPTAMREALRERAEKKAQEVTHA